MAEKTMAEKTRFDYTLVKLTKKEGVTTFDGKGIDDLDMVANKVLANYGLFVMLSRTLAGHENDTIQEKIDLIQKTWDWLADGCPKRERVMVSAYDSAVAKVNASTATAKEKAATLAVLKTAFNK